MRVSFSDNGDGHRAMVPYWTTVGVPVGVQPGTDTGGNTKAKPEIWENMDDFKARLEKMQQETAKLPHS